MGCFLSNVDVGIFPTKSFFGDVGIFPTKFRDDCFLSKCNVVLFPNFLFSVCYFPTKFCHVGILSTVSFQRMAMHCKEFLSS